MRYPNTISHRYRAQQFMTDLLILDPQHQSLKRFLPSGTETYLADLLDRHAVVVRLSRPRRSKLGDHRAPSGDTIGFRSTTISTRMPFSRRCCTRLLMPLLGNPIGNGHARSSRMDQNGRKLLNLCLPRLWLLTHCQRMSALPWLLLCATHQLPPVAIAQSY